MMPVLNKRQIKDDIQSPKRCVISRSEVTHKIKDSLQYLQKLGLFYLK